MTVGSLFAGIGGFDLGFTRAGFTVSWQVEIDEWCRGILARHFPNAQRHGDIRGVGAHNLEPVDVICGGFPCQPFSSAGKRGGTEDDRYLWPEMRRVIRELQPAWVVAENVDGLTLGEMVPVFLNVLSEMENEGYEVQPFVIPACAVDAPHQRNRVWILAHATGERPGEARQHQPARQAERVAGSSQALPYPHHERREERDVPTVTSRAQFDSRHDVGAYVPHTQGEQVGGAGQSRSGAFGTPGWEPEPGVGQLANGVPDRVAKLRALGNAVVPQIPELIARMILEVETMRAA